ncbi:MAG: hypothetical protein IJC04_02125 [Oscillospiraceae bacterium]|nr:hypothetical protein [Oscillospiraceae bacterium]
MTDADKKAELQELIESLCDVGFSKDTKKIDKWIQRLNKIYANKYRHTYSDIFFKLQEIIANSDSEVLETLGENLDVLKGKIELLIAQNSDDENLKITLAGYKKLADHINLEIGRYNFIKNQFSVTTTSTVPLTTPTTATVDKELEKKFDKLSEDVKNMRPITTQAKKELDRLDSRLESNKISSITTLTIFSAVVLAFSGGLTFEVGMLQGMASASAYRLVFVIALTGFVLFNTIFALLYLVGKLAGKSISTKCRYCSSDPNNSGNCICGEGTCTKELATGSIFCRITHKYCYVLIINIILLLVMYSDFFLWFFNGQASDIRFIISQSIPFIICVMFLLGYLFKRNMYAYRNKLKFKMAVLQKIVAPEEKENKLFTLFAESLSRIFFKEALNYAELYEKQIVGIGYIRALWRLEIFAKEQLLESSKNLAKISFKEHSLNKIKWKRYKKMFKQQFKHKHICKPKEQQLNSFSVDR